MDSLSVIICTHNPEEQTFRDCLSRLLSATKLYPPLEVIVIDNNSNRPVAKEEYVKNFVTSVPSARTIVETKQGLTPARLRGIKESTGDLLVFIDDDNFIAPDFLLRGVQLAEESKQVGSFSGQVKLQFESTPHNWTKALLGFTGAQRIQGQFMV